MRATDFANFFDFTIKEGETPDEFGEMSRYDVVDDQGCFSTRHINHVRDLVDCFDSMLENYIFDNLVEDGYELPNGFAFYDDTLEFAKENYGERAYITEVIAAFINPRLIENDVD